MARQLVEAFPWNTAPAYLVRDNDGAYGQAFDSRLLADHTPNEVEVPSVATAEFIRRMRSRSSRSILGLPARPRDFQRQ